MKHLLTPLTCLFLLSPNVVMGETVKFKDLVERKGIYYKKLDDKPFSGEVTGKQNGKLTNGRKYGLWKWYRKKGQVSQLENYNNGIQSGLRENYWDTGELAYQGHWKDGKKDGLWITFKDDGTREITDYFRDGEFIKRELH